MSDAMLHGILQMPPELWASGATDIAQRHSRYLEASKRIIELERQLDWALKSREAVWNSWNKALEERDDAMEELSRVRRELVASNRGAETNAKVNQGLCARLAEVERERDEARRERDEAKSIISRLVSRRIISWGDVDSVLEAINEEKEEA